MGEFHKHDAEPTKKEIKRPDSKVYYKIQFK